LTGLDHHHTYTFIREGEKRKVWKYKKEEKRKKETQQIQIQ